MGDTLGTDLPGKKAGRKPGWRKDDPGSQNQLRRFLEGGAATRFQRKHPLPSVGDRFGELTISRVELTERGGLAGIFAQCSCGAPEHEVHLGNLLKGASTRCNKCAKKKARSTRTKFYWKHSDALPDDEHRRRLLNRLASAISRCHNIGNKGFPNYGGRGISVHEEWRKDRSTFLLYIQSVPGWDDAALDMDRIDCDGGYVPGNLRFVSRAENNLNKRSVQDLQRRVDELERRLRHCKCGAAHTVYD